jgi:hypothetical protein
LERAGIVLRKQLEKEFATAKLNIAVLAETERERT